MASATAVRGSTMSAMATPSQSPGWYPAPDGNGQQWWNGATWSDARRNPDGTTTLGGLPGYQAAPPPGSLQQVPVPPPQSGLAAVRSNVSAAWLVPLVFSIVGFFFFNLFAVIALFIGIAAFRSTTGIGRLLSAVAIVISIAAIVSGILSFIRGEHGIEDVIF
jgi:hypothetical protein